MKTATTESFGLLIAYLIPGFIALWGMSHFSPEIQSWVGMTEKSSETIGGFLYGTVAAVGAGLTVSTIRWMIIDKCHQWTGIKQPDWRFDDLHSRTAAFEILIEIHYRYYQFYANSLIALLFAALAHWSDDGIDPFEVLIVILLSILFFAGSRDTLRKYYQRVAAMLEKQSL